MAGQLIQQADQLFVLLIDLGYARIEIFIPGENINGIHDVFNSSVSEVLPSVLRVMRQYVLSDKALRSDNNIKGIVQTTDKDYIKLGNGLQI